MPGRRTEKRESRGQVTGPGKVNQPDMEGEVHARVPGTHLLPEE